MALVTGKSGKCSNFGNCSLADARSTIDAPNGQDFVCTECGKPLLLMDTHPQAGGNAKKLAAGVLLLLAAGGIGWSLMKKAPAPELAPPAAVVQPDAPPKAKPAALSPGSGNCSEADERVGLCRRPAQ